MLCKQVKPMTKRQNYMGFTYELARVANHRGRKRMLTTGLSAREGKPESCLMSIV